MTTTRKVLIGVVLLILAGAYIAVRYFSGSTASAPTTAGSGASDTTTTPATETQGRYKNGRYIGTLAQSIYGPIQVAAVIAKGELSNVEILVSPNDKENSIEVNAMAMPILTSEAVLAQSAEVDLVSGATESSVAFKESLASALAKAK